LATSPRSTPSPRIRRIQPSPQALGVSGSSGRQ
jgi:hypothetical protein